MAKGMLVFVLRSAIGDCTNGGVTSKQDKFILVGPGIPEIFEAAEGEVYLTFEKMEIGNKTYYHAKPSNANGKWIMAGGNFVYTSDSRMDIINGGHPISVHDRIE